MVPGGNVTRRKRYQQEMVPGGNITEKYKPTLCSYRHGVCTDTVSVSTRCLHRHSLYRHGVYTDTVSTRCLYRQGVYTDPVSTRCLYRHCVYKVSVPTRCLYRHCVYKVSVPTRCLYRHGVCTDMVSILTPCLSAQSAPTPRKAIDSVS